MLINRAYKFRMEIERDLNASINIMYEGIIQNYI